MDMNLNMDLVIRNKPIDSLAIAYTEGGKEPHYNLWFDVLRGRIIAKVHPSITTIKYNQDIQVGTGSGLRHCGLANNAKVSIRGKILSIITHNTAEHLPVVEISVDVDELTFEE